MTGKTTEIYLSCLIPTIPARMDSFFPRLMRQLTSQAEGKPVELLALYDNKRLFVGRKRTALLRAAQGKFFTFIDDDDRVADDYIDQILSAIVTNPDADCIVYDSICSQNGGPGQLCKYGIEFEYGQSSNLWTGKPAHTMIWRNVEKFTELAFSDKNYGEDYDWVGQAWPRIEKQARINKVLYFYDFDAGTTTTRSGSVRPVFDIPKALPGEDSQTPVVSQIVTNKVTCSIVMSTHNKPQLLDKTLASIFLQKPQFAYEVVVVDDGSTGNETEAVCRRYMSFGHLLRYHRMENPHGYRNPSFARNAGYRLARGRVVIAQSDDVVHAKPDTIERLSRVEPGTFNIATVYNAALGDDLQPICTREMYTGRANTRPLFFLGSLLRKHIYAIGGNSEDFTEPGYEDDWFGKCLINGLGLRPVYHDTIMGFHQDHGRPNLHQPYHNMRLVFEKKYAASSSGEAPWIGGPAWEYVE